MSTSSATSTISDGYFEVYEHEAGGWAVRRVGEAQALSHHDTREQAERAAELHGSDGVGVDLRQNIFSNDPEQAVRARWTFAGFALMVVAAFALLALLAVLVVVT